MTELKSTQEELFSDLELLSALEALIFVSAEPLSAERMLEALEQSNAKVDLRYLKKILKILVKKWSDPNREYGRGFSLQEMAEGYAFVSAPEHAAIAKKMVAKKPLELNKAQLEVLAIVAYRQPITRVDLDDIRGVDGASALKRLLELKLVKILGKSEGLGRPLLYGTTKRFLEFFALNSLNDLPTLRQIEALGPDHDGNIEAEAFKQEIHFKDLFSEANHASMFSEETARLSEEALKSLDEAMLKIDGMNKTSGD